MENGKPDDRSWDDGESASPHCHILQENFPGYFATTEMISATLKA